MYATINFRTKKALRFAVKSWQDRDKLGDAPTVDGMADRTTGKMSPVMCHQLGPFGPLVADGEHTCEGPHDDHRWHARVRVSAGRIIRVLS